MFNHFKEYITKIDIKTNKIIKNKINNNNKIQNKFLERKEINKIINHEFEKNLEMNEFLDAFVKAIENNINKNLELKDRITFKKNLEKLCNKEIKKIFYKEIPEHVIQLKLDMLLSSVLSKIYSEKDINANLITIMSENYSLVPLYKGIEFTDPYSNQIHVFNKNYIIKGIINNVGIMNGYYKTIQKFVTNKFKKMN